MKVLSQYLPVLWENKTIVNRTFLNLHPLQFAYSYFLVLRAQPPVPGRTNGGGERENLQYFSESSDKENEIRIHVREKRIRETGLFSIFKASKLRESQRNMKSQAARILLTQFLALFFFYIQLSKLSEWTSPDFLLIFISKSRPCVLDTNLKKRWLP